jgi:hypothetical protein
MEMVLEMRDESGAVLMTQFLLWLYHDQTAAYYLPKILSTVVQPAETDQDGDDDNPLVIARAFSRSPFPECTPGLLARTSYEHVISYEQKPQKPFTEATEVRTGDKRYCLIWVSGSLNVHHPELPRSCRRSSGISGELPAQFPNFSFGRLNWLSADRYRRHVCNLRGGGTSSET